MTLSGKQRRFLRAQAHALEPVVSLGKEGITPSLVAAVSEALLTHELIKVRVLESAPLERQEAAERLPSAAKAELVGLIGRVVTLYKRHPNKPKLVLPREVKAGPGEAAAVAGVDEDEDDQADEVGEEDPNDA
jgi:RNA-binding protein